MQVQVRVSFGADFAQFGADSTCFGVDSTEADYTRMYRVFSFAEISSSSSASFFTRMYLVFALTGIFGDHFHGNSLLVAAVPLVGFRVPLLQIWVAMGHYCVAFFVLAFLD